MATRVRGRDILTRIAAVVVATAIAAGNGCESAQPLAGIDARVADEVDTRPGRGDPRLEAAATPIAREQESIPQHGESLNILTYRFGQPRLPGRSITPELLDFYLGPPELRVDGAPAETLPADQTEFERLGTHYFIDQYGRPAAAEIVRYRTPEGTWTDWTIRYLDDDEIAVPPSPSSQ